MSDFFGLTVEDLHAAAQACLARAATTDLDSIFGGRYRAHRYHLQKRRFEKAAESLENGEEVSTILPRDLVWAADLCDDEEQAERFSAAAEKLMKEISGIIE